MATAADIFEIADDFEELFVDVSDAVVRAWARRLRRLEPFEQAEAQPITTWIPTLRYDPEVTTTWRISLSVHAARWASPYRPPQRTCLVRDLIYRQFLEQNALFMRGLFRR